MKRIFIFTAVFLLSTFFLGCDGPEGPQGPAGETLPYPVSIDADIDYSIFNEDSTAITQVYISQTPTIPQVTINEIVIPFQGYSGSMLHYLDYYFPIIREDSASLLITYTAINGEPKSAWADIVVPGNFEITQPDTEYYEHTFNTDLTVAWTPSPGAEAYRIRLSMHIHYTDTTGVDQFYYFYEDSVHIGSETVTYHAEMIFPQLPEGVIYNWGDGIVRVYAESGPGYSWIPFNIQGDGTGFFSAIVATDYIDIHILFPE